MGAPFLDRPPVSPAGRHVSSVAVIHWPSGDTAWGLQYAFEGGLRGIAVYGDPSLLLPGDRRNPPRKYTAAASRITVFLVDPTRVIRGKRECVLPPGFSQALFSAQRAAVGRSWAPGSFEKTSKAIRFAYEGTPDPIRIAAYRSDRPEDGSAATPVGQASAPWSPEKFVSALLRVSKGA
jgi:hypothetical protein